MLCWAAGLLGLRGLLEAAFYNHFRPWLGGQKPRVSVALGTPSSPAAISVFSTRLPHDGHSAEPSVASDAGLSQSDEPAGHHRGSQGKNRGWEARVQVSEVSLTTKCCVILHKLLELSECPR